MDDTYPWPPALLDGQQDTGGKKIRDLRTRLKTERWASTFKTPDDLANQVMISVMQYRSTKTVEMLSEIQNINDNAREFGPSYLPNIQQQINQPTSQFVALRLGPVPWWDTRLHLAAALTSDFTEIQQFILLDGERRYLTMAPPVEIRRALANSAPNLETFYYNSRARAIGIGANEADGTIRCYPDAVKDTFPDGQQEEQIKRVVTPAFLRGLGIRSQGEVLDLFGSVRWSSQDIVRRRAPYVVVMRNGILEGVIDRMQLSSQIASLLLPT